MGKTYSDDSIQKLDPLEFTRLRPDTYCGSTADSTQLVREIVANSVDEHLAGHCYNITISYDKDDNIIEIEDDGQGIIPMKPMPGNPDKTILECAYGEINVSGKYDKEEGAVYENSTGAFGIGSKLTTYLSHWLEVTSMTMSGWEWVRFEEGRFVKREGGLGRGPTQAVPRTGIKVRFQPSEEFFDDPHPDIEKLREYLFHTVCVCPKLYIEFNGEEFVSSGLHDLNRKMKGDYNGITTSIYSSGEDGRRKFSCAIWPTDKDSSEITAFCNYSMIEAGTPITQVKTSITKAFNKWGQDMGVLKKNETLNGNMIQDGMMISFNLVSPNIRYDSQTKVRVTSTSDNAFISDILEKGLRVWLDTHIQEGKRILERALLAKKASEAAKKAKNAVLTKGVRVKQEKLFTLPTKLVDAWSKDRGKCELLVVEGDSAAAPMVAARDGEFQAVFPVRGKIINAYKQTTEKLLANQEINNLIQALGLEFDKRKHKLVYDISKLRYSRIISCTDADEDGKSIRSLLFTFLWSVCPELFTNGHVYAAIPPLFRVTTKKNEYVYLKDADALNNYKRKNSAKVQVVGRMKGIGEMDADEIGYCLTDTNTRNVIQITVFDVQRADKLFKDFYGKDVKPRVEYIYAHSEEAND